MCVVSFSQDIKNVGRTREDFSYRTKFTILNTHNILCERLRLAHHFLDRVVRDRDVDGVAACCCFGEGVTGVAGAFLPFITAFLVGVVSGVLLAVDGVFG